MTTRRNLLLGLMERPRRPLNFLLLTADDMNWNSPGCYGGKVQNITPNIDKLASQGMRFRHSHVTAAVCQPSRSVLMTGRYPHRNGAEGFQPIRNDVPTLQEQLRKAGYFQGIFAKNSHLEPRAKFCWDVYITPDQLGEGRAPDLYYQNAVEFFRKSKAAKQPFFLMANSQDPHRPFAGSDQEMSSFKKHMPYSRKVEQSEVDIPRFLADLPDVLKEMSEYYTSVYRCDQSLGNVLRALEEAGLAENTVVMFLSDNGISVPFAKTNCYLNSTRTPWIVRWPGKVKPGSFDTRHFISGIDFTPTILEAAGLPPLDGVDGASFVPVLEGRSQPGRDQIVTVFHETSARKRFEMRCVQTAQFGYIWNAWSDGKTEFQNEPMSGRTWPAMVAAAKNDPRIAARVELFRYRVPEELYDFDRDPDALTNLARDPAHQAELGRMRGALRAWMQRTGDPMVSKFAV